MESFRKETQFRIAALGHEYFLLEKWVSHNLLGKKVQLNIVGSDVISTEKRQWLNNQRQP